MLRRNTNQKQMVLEALEMLGHADSEKLIKYIEESYEGISLATIYRNLKILQDDGLVKKVKVGDLDVYETVKCKHYHFVCKNCGMIKDIESDGKIVVNTNIEDEVTDYDVVFYGVCKECKTN